jgi:flagellar hook-length control protein FliK
VQLHPVELGAVQVTAVLQGNNVNITLAAADPAARAAIAAALPQLHSHLGQTGYTGVDLSFGQPNPQAQTSAGQQGHQGQSQSRGGHSSSAVPAGASTLPTVEGRPIRRAPASGLDALDRWL